MDVIWENITDPIFHYARERPQAPAFHEGHVTLSYAALAALVGKAAVHLDGLGIRAGDRVAPGYTDAVAEYFRKLSKGR